MSISDNLAKAIFSKSKRIYLENINENIGLRRWRTNLADVQSSSEKIINIQVINNSIGEGYGGGNGKGWTNLLRKYFSDKFENVSNGAIPYYQYSYYPLPEWTFTGTWISGDGYGFYNSVKYTNNSNATASITFFGTGIDILVVKTATTGSILVSIDGGDPVTYNTSNPTELYMSNISIQDLANSQHTMIISKTNDSKFFFLIGACPKLGVRGVRVNTVGKNGGIITPCVANTKVLFAEIDYWQPALTIIEMFANDVSSNLSPALYRANIQSMITKAKEFGDVLLFPTGIRQELYAYKQQEYIDVLKELAMVNSICFINAFNNWGESFDYATNTLGVLVDAVHPNARGHQDLSNLIISILDK